LLVQTREEWVSSDALAKIVIGGVHAQTIHRDIAASQ
jgi:hypothetical protein